MAGGFIQRVLGSFRGQDQRIAHLERVVKTLRNQLEALPSATSFGDGVGAWHPLSNNRDIIMVEVLGHNVAYNCWFARKIVYQAGAGGSIQLVPDEDDQDNLWIFAAPGQVFFPGARGFAVHVGELNGITMHIMASGEVYGITARLTNGPNPTDMNTYPWTQITDGSYQALTHSSSIGGTTLGLARARDSYAYDATVFAPRQEYFATVPVRLYWDAHREEMWFSGGVDPSHGPCEQ